MAELDEYERIKKLILSLEEAHGSGKVDEEVYKRLSREYKGRLRGMERGLRKCENHEEGPKVPDRLRLSDKILLSHILLGLMVIIFLILIDFVKFNEPHHLPVLYYSCRRVFTNCRNFSFP
jgi:hypothetical protein